MFFYVLLHVKYVESEPDYPPLPQGKAYTLDDDDDKWNLNGLSSIANGIALTLRSQPPYGKAFILLFSILPLVFTKLAPRYVAVWDEMSLNELNHRRQTVMGQMNTYICFFSLSVILGDRLTVKKPTT